MISCRPRCLRTSCTATAPDAVRTFRTNATARTYPLSVPIGFRGITKAQVTSLPSFLPASNVLTQADGTLVARPGMPDPDLIPSLLAASDVLGTGWFGAVAVEAGPGKTVAVGNGRTRSIVSLRNFALEELTRAD